MIHRSNIRGSMRGSPRDKFFIQSAIKHKGALTKTVQRRFGKKGFVKGKEGKDIKESVKRKLAKEKGVTGQRARLALTLEKIRRNH